MTGRFRRSRRETAGLAGRTPKRPCRSPCGGGHGALTWRVLDALLEDGRLGVEAITGASAGAINAVVLVQGWLEGGIDGARSRLENFWRSAGVGASVPRPNADSSTWCWASGTTRPGWT